MDQINARGYAHPEVLVSTDWVAAHHKDAGIRLVESNEDTLLYATGHLPDAVHVDWTADLNDQLRRDYITRPGFESLMSSFTATKATGGRAMPSGSSSCSVTRTRGSWTAAA
jgi:thiosulfate/3-mercaptopyruvate sulfurtransferase